MTNYIRYHDGLEHKQENEDEIIDAVVASMMRMNQKVFDKHRHATRDAHAKSHGVLTGHVTVYGDLPDHLAQGVFARPATFPVVIRLSTAPGDIHSDKLPAPRGMAIKMLGVEGHQFLPARQGASTQDLLLVNHPVIAFGHAAAYLKTQKLLEKHMDDPDMTKRIVAALARGGSKALHALGIESPTLDTLGAPNNHILGETFFSMAAIRYGDYVAKLCAAPFSENVRALTGQAVESDLGDSALRDLVVAHFKREGAEYELRAQLCTGTDEMPIEDASIDWPQEKSPYQPVARLTIPSQDAYSPQRRAFADDVLSFNPWHCVDAHRPLGSIMRARIKAYEASSAFRHTMNAQPRVEIEDISQVPD